MIETAVTLGMFLTTIGLIVPIYYKLGKIEFQLKIINGGK